MKRVLVTGGTGHLGGQLVPRLEKQGCIVRVMSRGPAQLPPESTREWAQADLVTGSGLEAAVNGVDVIIHAASQSVGGKTEQADVAGTALLLEKAQQAGVQHIVYISIVGIDKISFSYYQHKLAAEKLIENGPVPWTILRAPQFFSLVDLFLEKLALLPLMLVPAGWQFQPIADGEVADHLVALALQAPVGHAPDIAGPEILPMREIVRIWRQAHGIRKPLIHIPVPGGLSAGFRQGLNTVPHNPHGKITWAQWVQQQANSPQQPAVHRQQQGS